MWVIVMFLSAFWTHSDGKDVHFGWPEGEQFLQNVFVLHFFAFENLNMNSFKPIASNSTHGNVIIKVVYSLFQTVKKNKASYSKTKSKKLKQRLMIWLCVAVPITPVRETLLQSHSDAVPLRLVYQSSCLLLFAFLSPFFLVSSCLFPLASFLPAFPGNTCPSTVTSSQRSWATRKSLTSQA